MLSGAEIFQIIKLNYTCFNRDLKHTILFTLGLSFSHTIIYKDNNRVISYQNFEFIHGKCHLLSLATNPKYRHRGIGGKLMLETVHIAKSKNINDIYFEVRTKNVNAWKMYETIGFRRTGIRKNYYKRPIDDAYIYKYKKED